jgi:hypothetical protein
LFRRPPGLSACLDRPGIIVSGTTAAGGGLDHLLVYGEQHLRRILTEYARHYNEHRPHQSREQRPPLYEPGEAVDVTARIERRQVVHGLINEYRRAA